MCCLAKPSCSISGQALLWITDFSHRSQYLQCLYHVSSYAKAAHGEFNCQLLSMKKGSTSCNCSLKVESPSLTSSELLTRGNCAGRGVGSQLSLQSSYGKTEWGCNLQVFPTYWEVSASQAQVIDERKGHKNTADEGAEDKVLLLLTHHKPRTDSLKGHQHEQFPLTALNNAFKLSKTHLLFSTQVSHKYFSHSLYTCKNLIFAISRMFLFKPVCPSLLTTIRAAGLSFLQVFGGGWVWVFLQMHLWWRNQPYL